MDIKPFSVKFKEISINLSDIDETNVVDHSRDHYEIVSKVAYLIGIFEDRFDTENNLDKEIYKKLNSDKSARIIRNLCICRTFAERNFKKIIDEIGRNYKSLYMLPGLMPQESLNSLDKDGVSLYSFRQNPMPFIIEINKKIKERIDNCRNLFPEWIKWDYIKEVFIMPNGTTEDGCKSQTDFFYQHMGGYPHKMYINWPAMEEENGIYILRSDRTFVTELYKWHMDEFNDLSKVSDVSDRTKVSIKDFIDKSEKCVFLVDCENSDPYSLCAAINGLEEIDLEKIEKIILYDDVNAASAWEMLKKYIKIPVEYKLVERIKDNKSLVDVSLATGACNEFYRNNVDSFVIVSSDSDYWGLMQNLPEARFLLMIEHDKSSSVLKGALLKHDIFYCYIDDFYDGTGIEIKTDALVASINKQLKEMLPINVDELLKTAKRNTRVRMLPTEEENFKKHYLKDWSIEVDEEGNLKIRPKKK